MSNQLRRVFQIDGVNGGILSIAERPNDPFVVLVISTESGEAQIRLNQDDFKEMCDLKYTLRFGYKTQDETQDETQD